MIEPNKKSIFSKFTDTLSTGFDAGQVLMRNYMTKARSEIAAEEDTAFYRKSLYKDITYSIGAQGWQEKTNRLSYTYLNQMTYKNTAVAAIIQTYQNMAAAHCVVAENPHQKGFRIKLKNEREALIKILVELSHIEAVSKPASIMETFTYFATEPKPGQLSVSGKSLSIVFGIPIHWIG